MEWSNLTKALGELDEQKVDDLLNEFLAANPTEEEAKIAVAACQAGMGTVGDLFEKGEYFVGDLIFAGELLTATMDRLKTVLDSGSSEKTGKIVLGTVFGDLHDIGKNIFRSMAEAAGFEVYDLGIDQPVSAFVEKVREVKPDIVGMSGVLTPALTSMKDTVDGLKAAGLRDQVKIIIGGNPVSESSCKMIGADAFTDNAAVGVNICKGWVK
ncbi:MAG: cobalamin-binding protein [Dehalobacter sp. 4CP]|uniref:cobalamin B12-binding domain-containing protein n=1 Tax=Dehalobacter sp. CP TaxID=2594474 RepID=UPI0013C6579A|nr:cobalamin-binding protein [Dehalobacter sp. 4CP]